MLAIPRPEQPVNMRPELRSQADKLMDRMIREFYERVPYGKHLASAKDVNKEYYRRHTVEIILRLRIKRTCDALAIQYFTKHDPVRAKQWAHYTDDEMLHDTDFFVKDLTEMGMTLEQIYETEPLLSTKLLLGYYLYGLEIESSPLALIASVYFVEYTTTRTQVEWLNNVSQSLGEGKVAGARGHVGLDLDQDHDDFVWTVLASLVKSEEDERKPLAHIENVGRLYAAYFMELHELTIQKKSAQPLSSVGEHVSVLEHAAHA